MDSSNPYQSTSSGSDERSQPVAPFYAECDCGLRVGATAGMAGTETTCLCGRTVAVPGLSQLRRNVGKHAYGDDPAARIKRTLASKPSLPGEMCLECGTPTTGVLHIQAECERMWTKKSGRGRIAIALFSIPLYLLTLLVDGRTVVSRHGRDTVVRLRVTMCIHCQARFPFRTGRRALRRLICEVPEYAQLLAAFPQAALYRTNGVRQWEDG